MSVLRKVGVVSAMTAISRVFGLVREILMAHFFGTGTLQSAFVIAFRIPNLFRRLFGEGALGAAFIPVFAEIERTEGHDRAQSVVDILQQEIDHRLAPDGVVTNHVDRALNLRLTTLRNRGLTSHGLMIRDSRIKATSPAANRRSPVSGRSQPATIASASSSNDSSSTSA